MAIRFQGKCPSPCPILVCSPQDGVHQCGIGRVCCYLFAAHVPFGLVPALPGIFLLESYKSLVARKSVSALLLRPIEMCDSTSAPLHLDLRLEMYKPPRSHFWGATVCDISEIQRHFEECSDKTECFFIEGSFGQTNYTARNRNRFGHERKDTESPGRSSPLPPPS